MSFQNLYFYNKYSLGRKNSVPNNDCIAVAGGGWVGAVVLLSISGSPLRGIKLHICQHFPSQFQSDGFWSLVWTVHPDGVTFIPIQLPVSTSCVFRSHPWSPAPSPRAETCHWPIVSQHQTGRVSVSPTMKSGVMAFENCNYIRYFYVYSFFYGNCHTSMNTLLSVELHEIHSKMKSSFCITI